MTAVSFSELFETARKADIVALANVPLGRSGRRLRGECPLCGASKGKKADGAFSVDPGQGLFKCFACDKGGDVIELAALLRRENRRAAAEWLTGLTAEGAARDRGAQPGRVARDDRAAVEPAPNMDLAARLWRESRPATGTLVETYLQSRGLGGWVLEAMLRRLRYHPAAFWGFERETGPPLKFPAMVGVVEAPAGDGGSPRWTGGVHLTYLAPDGRSKAFVTPAKRMFGPQAIEGRPGGVWLAGPGGAGAIVVGEGIESTGSAAQLQGERCRMVATLSLRALQGGWLADKWGRFDPDCPAGDPERPAFVWPPPAIDRHPARLIAIDRDMKPIHIKCRRATGGTYGRALTSDERARICAALAAQAWRRAAPDAPANAVRVIGPGPGRDFNDELMAVLEPKPSAGVRRECVW